MTHGTLQHWEWHDRVLSEAIAPMDVVCVSRATGCEIRLEADECQQKRRIRIRCASEDVADHIAGLLAAFALDRVAREGIRAEQGLALQLRIAAAIDHALGRTG